MVNYILRLGYIQKISYFKKPAKRPYIKPVANVISFLLEIALASFVYLLIEKPFNELFSGTLFDFLKTYFGEGIYFVMTTATTVGYGDLSPSTLLGKLFVMTVLFLFISTRLIGVLGSAFEAKQEENELKRIGRLFDTMKNHIIIYADADTLKRDSFLYLKRFVQQTQSSNKFKHDEILFVNHNEDMNTILNEAVVSNDEFKNNFTHLNANIDENNFFEKISIEDAKHVFILGNPDDTHSDSKVLDFALRVEEETKYNKDVTAEVVNDSNRKRIMVKGGVDVVMRPNRAYPEMLVRATISYGSAQVLEELITIGKDTLETFKIPEKEFTYGELLYKLSMNDIGTTLAMIYKDGLVDPNLMGSEKVSGASEIIIMVNEMRTKSYKELQTKIIDVVNEL